MEFIKRTNSCVFQIDGVFIHRPNISKRIGYEDSKDKNKADDELRNWFHNLPNLSFICGNYCSLYGGRVVLTPSWSGSNYNYHISIDGISVINTIRPDLSIYDSFNTTALDFQKLLQILNDITTYGVDGYVSNYRNAFFQNLDQYIGVMENSENEAVQKNIIGLFNAKHRLERWRPMNKSNEKMDMITDKLEKLLKSPEMTDDMYLNIENE